MRAGGWLFLAIVGLACEGAKSLPHASAAAARRAGRRPRAWRRGAISRCAPSGTGRAHARPARAGSREQIVPVPQVTECVVRGDQDDRCELDGDWRNFELSSLVNWSIAGTASVILLLAGCQSKVINSPRLRNHRLHLKSYRQYLATIPRQPSRCG